MLLHGSINTDVGLHLECFPQIFRHPPLKYKVDLSPYFLSPHYPINSR